MTKLTLSQAVRNAIEAEKASAAFYKSLVEYTEDEATQQFFKDMAELEQAHIRQIEAGWRNKGADDLPAQADREMDFVETVPIWKDAEDISFEEALILARDAENQAVLYYDAMAESFAGELKSLFQELARQEEEHAVLLSKRIAEKAGSD